MTIDPGSITIPAELPIAERADEIAEAVRAHPVVVVAGETGSGKSTQLPKICLALGREHIAHTQPRRLAARTIADRVAEELGSTPGDLVGSRVRFSDRTSRRTRLTVMTDGILLAEISRDRLLRRYDTVIVDEAHERSLTIDFLLGYLATILPRRPDLRVLVTSATIDPERFAAHFAPVVDAPVPVLEVSGRMYPVELRYRPGEGDQVQAVLDAVDELADEAPGDVLVFLSGEREIRDTAEALRGHLSPTTEVLPLFARLSAADQHRVFAPHGGRRVVLATNIAETSLTVPGIRYVVDAGTARISRYSQRTKVQRLPIEPVSRSSADQRAGRCGRVADGVCIRLYSEVDYDARPRWTDPEILRTNLAAVILQMAALGLGELEEFPFLDPPDRRSLRDGSPSSTSSGPCATAGSPGWADGWRGCRSTHASGGWCWRRSGSGASRRCWSSRRPCRSRTPVSVPRTPVRPRSRPTAGSRTRPQTWSRTSTSGCTSRSGSERSRAVRSGGCAGPSTCTT